MQHRQLGGEIAVSSIGVGCMGMSKSIDAAYGPADLDECIATIHRAIEQGVTLFDTAESYGPWTSEQLLGRAIRGRRDKIKVATKIGFAFSPNGERLGLDGRPHKILEAVDGCLTRLGVDEIDLLFLHRIDPAVSVEESVGAMADLVSAGKVRSIGLSEAAAATIRRAHAVFPMAALQSEYSLWERGIETDILPVTRELGIGLVAYSPLGRGFFSGAFASPLALGAYDYRHKDPRFSEENLAKNYRMIEPVRKVADRHGCSLAQVALAWLLARGDDIVPIPGVKRLTTLEDSLKADQMVLSSEDLTELSAEPFADTAGDRYGEAMMRLVRT